MGCTVGTDLTFWEAWYAFVFYIEVVQHYQHRSMTEIIITTSNTHSLKRPVEKHEVDVSSDVFESIITPVTYLIMFVCLILVAFHVKCPEYYVPT